MIAPAASAASFEIARGADLGAFIADGRLVVGEVRSVPAGKYAKQALEALGMSAGLPTPVLVSLYIDGLTGGRISGSEGLHNPFDVSPGFSA